MGGRGSSGSSHSSGRSSAARKAAQQTDFPPLKVGNGTLAGYDPTLGYWYKDPSVIGGGFWNSPLNKPIWFHDPSRSGGGYYMDPYGNQWTAAGRKVSWYTIATGTGRGSPRDPTPWQALQGTDDVSMIIQNLKHPETLIGRSPYPSYGDWNPRGNPYSFSGGKQAPTTLKGIFKGAPIVKPKTDAGKVLKAIQRPIPKPKKP